MLSSSAAASREIKFFHACCACFMWSCLGLGRDKNSGFRPRQKPLSSVHNRIFGAPTEASASYRRRKAEFGRCPPCAVIMQPRPNRSSLNQFFTCQSTRRRRAQARCFSSRETGLSSRNVILALRAAAALPARNQPSARSKFIRARRPPGSG